jgi:heat-inducible transcriptional repressor
MNRPSQASALNSRARHLLKTLIDCYVSEGQPVGSKALADASGLNISTATIRNVMASLDHQGLVTAPHTSAGRVPTEQGFRFFIDSMLEVNPVDSVLLQQLQQQLHPDLDRDALIDSASTLLSDMSKMAGIITIPKGGQLSLRQIEFLPLPDKKILAILVVNEKDVQNRVIHVDREYSQNELTHIANYLNQNFNGEDIFEVRKHLINEMHRTRNEMDELMKATVDLADRALKPDHNHDEDYRLQGKSNLIRFNDLDHSQHLQQMFELFESKRDMLQLLDRCIQSEDIQVFIGGEAGLEGMGDCSIITSPYSVDGKILGVLGVIGPTRMQYNKMISLVDVTAKLLGSALNPK